MQYLLWLMNFIWFISNEDSFELVCLECNRSEFIRFVNYATRENCLIHAVQVATAHYNRAGLCMACHDDLNISQPTQKEVRQISDIVNALAHKPKPKRKFGLGLPGFDDDALDKLWENSNFFTHKSPEFPLWSRPALDFVGPKWVIIHIAARELFDRLTSQPIANVEEFIEARIKEINEELPLRPTIAVTSKSGLTLIWVWDANDVLRPWGSVSPFGMRLISAATGMHLPNLGKRLTVFSRPFPIRRRLPQPQIVEVKWTRDDQDFIIGAEVVTPFTRVPGQIVIGVGPQDPTLDGAFRVSRSLIADGIFELSMEMRKDENGWIWESDQVADIANKAKRKRIRKMVKKAHAMTKKLQAVAVWQGRIFSQDFNNLGGLLKGDLVTTELGFSPPDGVDILVDGGNNLKEEMFSTTGELIFLAEPVSDKRDPRWTDRMTMIHHYDWLLKDIIFDALTAAHKDVIESLMNNQQPDFIKFQQMGQSLNQMFADDAINVYSRRHDAMMKEGVFNMSPSAIKGVVQNRWMKKLAPKTIATDDGEIIRQDTRKFPVPISEFRTIKPIVQAKLAGRLAKNHHLADGHFMSTDMGLILNDRTFVWAMEIMGGGDQDDKVPSLIIISENDEILPLWAGATLDVKAGDMVAVIYRLPIGTSSNGEELASEYIILKPTAEEEAEIRNVFGNDIPVVDLSKRPTRKDMLDYSPCDPACTKMHFHRSAPWTPRQVQYNSTTYTWAVFIDQAKTLAKIQAMGGVGARANIEMVLFQHQFVFPFRCHTEGWVDLFTKSICHPDDVDDWMRFNQEDLDLIEAQSQTFPLDATAFERIRASYSAANAVQIANRELFKTVTDNHLSSMEELEYMLTGVKIMPRPDVPEDYGAVGIAWARMKAMTDGLPFMTAPRKATARGFVEGAGSDLPILLCRINRWVDELKNRKQELHDAGHTEITDFTPKGDVVITAQEWDQIGDWTVQSLEISGKSEQQQILLVMEALAYLYHGQIHLGHPMDDSWLLNGRLLDRTIKAMKAIKKLAASRGIEFGPYEVA